MLSRKALSDMSEMDIEKIDPESLVDIATVSINQDLPHEEKLLSYMQQVGNPYCFKSGDTPVHIRFAGDDAPLSDALVRYFSRLKRK